MCGPHAVLTWSLRHFMTIPALVYWNLLGTQVILNWLCSSGYFCQTLMDTDKVLHWEKMKINDIWCSPQSFSCLAIYLRIDCLSCACIRMNRRVTVQLLGADISQGSETSAPDDNAMWEGAATGEAQGVMKAHVLDTHLRLRWSEKASWRKQELSQVLKDEEGWRRGRGWEEERARARAEAWWEREWCLAQAASLELGVRKGRGRRRGSGVKERALLRSFYCSLGTTGSSGF